MERGGISKHGQAVSGSADAGPDDVPVFSSTRHKPGDGHCETSGSLSGEGFCRSGVDVVDFLPCGRHGGRGVSTGDGDGLVEGRSFVGSGQGRIKVRQSFRKTGTRCGRASCDDGGDPGLLSCQTGVNGSDLGRQLSGKCAANVRIDRVRRLFKMHVSDVRSPYFSLPE